MGKQKWFRNKSYYVVLLCVVAALSAVAGIIAPYIVNGNKKVEK